jgi:hypothetical protein
MNDARIKLIFSTTAGDLEDEFPVSQPLHSLKREVMARLKLDLSKADDFVVVLDGANLDEQKTLKQLGVPEGSILVLERREIVKI